LTTLVVVRPPGGAPGVALLLLPLRLSVLLLSFLLL